ncbi:hypothetical protein M758_6G131400 [Ceratodon purpureus]|nr:hypothetical protein M758_6G131400 [Ceratodon purpureus]
MEDEEWEATEEEEEEDDAEEEKDVRKGEQHDDFCDVCNTGGILVYCDTCTAVFHRGCLDPHMKVVPRGAWSCPKCADPLGDVEKILDMQTRPIKVPGKASDHGADKAPDQAADEQAEDEDDDYDEAGDEASDPAPDKDSKEPPPKLVKQHLIKWKSRSFLHCSWVTSEDLERGKALLEKA